MSTTSFVPKQSSQDDVATLESTETIAELKSTSSLNQPIRFRRTPHREVIRRQKAANSGDWTVDPRTLWFFRKRVTHGAVKLLGTVLAFGVGGFLLSEIPYTPKLVVQLAILGGLGICLAVALSLLAARDIFGRIVIDKIGIRQFPWYCRCHVAWSDITDWQMWEPGLVPEDMVRLTIWTAPNEFPAIFPAAWLSSEDRRWLRNVLNRVAPEKSLG